MKRDNHVNGGGVSLVPAWPAPRHLALRHGERLAYRDTGAPDGDVWLAIHGGPGSSAQPGLLRPFDARRHRVLLLDQRGAGASRPRGKTAGNQLARLVDDMELLRTTLGIDQWSLLAGSWGTVVALAYVQQHPQHVARMVLRGAFGLKRRELRNVLQPLPRTLRQSPSAGAWPLRRPQALAAGFKALQSTFQRRALDQHALAVLRYWQWLETLAAERGMQRSAVSRNRPLAPATRAAWASMRRSLRRQRGAFDQPRVTPADRALWQKFRVQAHYLARRGFVGPATLDQAVKQAARHGVAVDWVHGRFDSICLPANSRRWAQLGQATGAAPVRLLQPHSGHLGTEPDMLRGLRWAVNHPPEARDG